MGISSVGAQLEWATRSGLIRRELSDVVVKGSGIGYLSLRELREGTWRGALLGTLKDM
jgi:hypothetical protein